MCASGLIGRRRAAAHPRRPPRHRPGGGRAEGARLGMSRSQPQTERRKLGISCLNPCHPGRSSAARVAPVWWHFPPFPKSSRLAKSSSHANPLLHEAKPPSRTPPERHLPYGESGEGTGRVEITIHDNRKPLISRFGTGGQPSTSPLSTPGRTAGRGRSSALKLPHDMWREWPFQRYHRRVPFG